MFSKTEAQNIKREFWIQFAAAYPRKWILYQTKIKDVSFKFYIDNKKAQVLLDIEPKDDKNRIIYFEKMQSLQSILLEEYVPDAVFQRDLYLENGKIISRIWVEMLQVSCNNKETWPFIFDFFNTNMSKFEEFFLEYEDYIKDLEMNT